MAPMTNERLTNRSVWPLTAPVLAPACLVAWVVATTITENGVFGVVLVPLAFVLVALVRRPVEEYIVSRGPARPALWEGLVQFTPGYFEFHAGRRGVQAWPYRWACHLLLALLAAGFTALAAWSMVDLASG